MTGEWVLWMIHVKARLDAVSGMVPIGQSFCASETSLGEDRKVKILRASSEEEMILEFLKAECTSERFSDQMKDALGS